MKILVYSAKEFEKEYFVKAGRLDHEIEFVSETLTLATASKSKGFEVISVFTADDATAPVIKALAAYGIRLIAIRAAGYDNVDIGEANKWGITVSNVPEYSPYSVAEHAVALLLALNRKLIIADRQVKEQNFLLDNLIGFDLKGKTVGIVGTGRIGAAFARIMHGFGCQLLGYDDVKNEVLHHQLRMRYVSLTELCKTADVISIHIPLTPQTHHVFGAALFQQMKKGVILINTARGALVKTEDIVTFLENGHIGGYGMDVYEKERGIFFYNRKSEKLNDPLFENLLSRDNVVITPHQGFATKEALTNIAETTFENINAWSNYNLSGNELTKSVSLNA